MAKIKFVCLPKCLPKKNNIKKAIKGNINDIYLSTSPKTISNVPIIATHQLRNDFEIFY